MNPQILRLPEVQALTKLSRSTIYRLVDAGEFPQRLALGPRAVGWHSNAIAQWVQARAPKGAV